MILLIINVTNHKLQSTIIIHVCCLFDSNSKTLNTAYTSKIVISYISCFLVL